jgi:hypothetical protein
LGTNILIRPQTLRQIEQRRFDEVITNLRYGAIAINGWTGLGFQLPQTRDELSVGGYPSARRGGSASTQTTL